MKIGLIGDLHADVFPKNINAVMDYMENTDADFYLQTGDYLAYHINWPKPLYWITGNHENNNILIKYINNTYQEKTNNHWLIGGHHIIQNINIMSLPGFPNLNQKPGPASYPENIYELCLQSLNENIDVFISHGCGYPFWVWSYNKKIKKATKNNYEEIKITELIKKVKPKYAISGHNHRFEIDEKDGIILIRLGFKPKDMFYTIDI